MEDGMVHKIAGHVGR